MRTHCTCGLPYKFTRTVNRYPYCPACNTRRSREVRERSQRENLVPVLVVGAKARLRAYLDDHGIEAIAKVLEFLVRQQRSAA